MFNTVILLVLRGSVTQGIEQRHCRHKNDKITVLAILVIYRANNFYLPSYLMASNNNIQQELLPNTPYVDINNIFGIYTRCQYMKVKVICIGNSSVVIQYK